MAPPDEALGEIASNSGGNNSPELFEKVKASDLVGPLVDSMPEPTAPEGSVQMESQVVVDAASRPQLKQTPLVSIPEIKDNFGTVFDPEIHAHDDGKPRYRNDGSFQKWRGRKSKKEFAQTNPPAAQLMQEGSEAGSTPLDPFASLPQPKPGQDQYDQSADLMLNMSYGLAAMALGAEIAPEFDSEGKRTKQGEAEHESMRFPLAAALREKQKTGFTPTQMFCAAVIAHIAAKSQKKTVKEHFTLWYVRIKGWFSKK